MQFKGIKVRGKVIGERQRRGSWRRRVWRRVLERVGAHESAALPSSLALHTVSVEEYGSQKHIPASEHSYDLCGSRWEGGGRKVSALYSKSMKRGKKAEKR